MGRREQPIELAEHAIKMARTALESAEKEALLACRAGRNAGMTADQIAQAIGWSRSTLYRRMIDVGYWP